MVITAARFARKPESTCRCWSAARRCPRNSPTDEDRARLTATPTFYAKDAMTGLRLMNELMDPATRGEALRDAHAFTAAAAPVAEAAPRGPGGDCAKPQGSHGSADSGRALPRPQGARRAATCTRSGATSIRSCCSGGTWASRATSKSAWPSATPKRWSCSTEWKRSSSEAARLHEGARGLAVLRSRAGRQPIHLFDPGG